MYKSKFTLSDDTQEFEGYTDGTLWDGWANVCFTREQVEKVLTLWEYEFTLLKAFEGRSDLPYPVLFIYNFEGVEPTIIHSTPAWIDEDFIDCYYLDLEFMEVKKNG